MTTLIIGCGYLGRRVARQLLERGDRVVATTRDPDRLDDLARAGVEVVRLDVLDPATIAALPDADRTLYCVGFDRSAGVSIARVYVDGLRAVLEARGGRLGRLVYASSTGVYGGQDGGWVDEDSPVNPTTDSARACRDAEVLLGSSAIILRFAGLYGPGRIIRRDAIVRGEPIAGDPDRSLNMIQIDDAARAVLAAFDRGEPGRLYLVADDEPSPRSDYYRRVAEALGAPPPRFEPPAPGSPVAARDGSNKRISNRRMHTELRVDLRYPTIATGVPAALAAGADG